MNAKRIYQKPFDDDNILGAMRHFAYSNVPLPDRNRAFGKPKLTRQTLTLPEVSAQDTTERLFDADRKADVLSRLLSSAIFENNLMECLSIILHAIKTKDITTYWHSLRVAQFADKIASALDYKTLDRKKVILTALLHDVGKLGIDDAVLTKPGILDNEEWKEMKGHPNIGANIVKMLPKLMPISRYIRLHHERYDGNGYPDKLRKTDIPLVSRVISVADAYDAMTHKRPYRTPLSKRQALAELEEQKGKQFDPYIVRVFATLLRYRNYRKAKKPRPLMRGVE